MINNVAKWFINDFTTITTVCTHTNSLITNLTSAIPPQYLVIPQYARRACIYYMIITQLNNNKYIVSIGGFFRKKGLFVFVIISLYSYCVNRNKHYNIIN